MPKNILDQHLLEDDLDLQLKQILSWWQQILLFGSIYFIPYLVLRYFTRTIMIVRWSPVVDLLLQGVVISIFYILAVIVIEKVQHLKIPKPKIKLRLEQNLISFYILMAAIFTFARMVALVVLIGATSLFDIQNAEQFFVNFFIIDIILVTIDCFVSSYHTNRRFKEFRVGIVLSK